MPRVCEAARVEGCHGGAALALAHLSHPPRACRYGYGVRGDALCSLIGSRPSEAAMSQPATRVTADGDCETPGVRES